MTSNWNYLYRFRQAIAASQEAREGLVKAFIEVMRTGRELRELGRVVNFPTMQDTSVQTNFTVTEDKDVQTTRNEGRDISTQTYPMDELDTPDIEEEEMSRTDHQPSPETDDTREVYFRGPKRVYYDPSSMPRFERSEEERSSRQIIGVCFNCQSTAHRYGECPYPTQHSFCFQCGLPEVTVKDCPRCTPGWKAQDSNREGVTDDTFPNRFRRKAMRERYRLGNKAYPYSRPKGGRPTARERRRRL